MILLALLWLGAKLGGEAATRLKLPTVVGELVAGMLLMALHRQWGGFPDVAIHPAADLLATIGVIILMFSVGMESTVAQMMKQGLPALRVAVVGVILPVALGVGAVLLILGKDINLVGAVFVGACLCATSVGISARVLQEKNAGDSPEGRVILGAAVIDDVLGLLVLVLVSGLATMTVGGGIPWGPVGKTLLLAMLFLSGALTLGRWATPHLFRMANRFRVEEVLLPISLAFAFLMAWGGGHAGLAPIVGAYAAGLILEPTHIELLEEREARSLESLIHPLVTALAPLFFVVMGARIDPRSLLQVNILGLTLALTVLGALGKYAAGFVAGRGFNPHLIGWGMMPRGEVGLIFVAVGAQLKILDGRVQAAVVMAMLFTTVLGPIGLDQILRRRAAQS
ncbi:MAG: cation:proton antiporter [Holophaga sp.]|nr:cation:proton antiporter [Holophaga sp.]